MSSSIGGIGAASAATAFNAYQATGAAPAAAAPQAAPAAPAPTEVPSTYDVALDVPGDADPCTDCGRAELEKAYEMQALEQGKVDAEVLQQVAAAYAASRVAA